MYRILFVCTGNSCRSPMAEGLLKKALNNDPDVVVASAGIMAPENRPPTDFTLVTMKEKRVEIEAHRSRRLTQEMAETADLILVMEEGHRRFIVNLIPETSARTFLLTRYASGRGVDIEDPIGRDLDTYRRIAAMIQQEIRRILPCLKRNIRNMTGS